MRPTGAGEWEDGGRGEGGKRGKWGQVEPQGGTREEEGSGDGGEEYGYMREGKVMCVRERGVWGTCMRIDTAREREGKEKKVLKERGRVVSVACYRSS